MELERDAFDHTVREVNRGRKEAGVMLQRVQWVGGSCPGRYVKKAGTEIHRMIKGGRGDLIFLFRFSIFLILMFYGASSGFVCSV